jgi:Holliday junction resolvase-like predicted endonuclease
VDAQKQARLISAASRYIVERHVRKEVQFDVVSVILAEDRTEVEYIPEAFFPIWKRY